MTIRRRKIKKNAALSLSNAVFHALEPRFLLTSTLDGSGLLTIDGTGGNDDISVAISNDILTVSLYAANDGSFDLTQTPVTSIQISGTDGDDSISLATINIPATLSGGDGND